MKMTFYHSAKQLRRVQDLVKQYNGRFECNPLVSNDTALIEISFEDVHAVKGFSVCRQILQQKYF